MAPDLPHLSIGALAEKTGCKVETIRYYERIGLMPDPVRTAGGHRLYRDTELRRLSFVRRARQLGFALDTVRALLGMADIAGDSCAEVERISRRHLADVHAKIADLKALETVLADMVAECEAGTLPACPIIDALYEGRA